MNIGLFIPCYVNQLYPNAAIATLELLQKLGADVSYPAKQTCCGQPMANSGYEHLTQSCNDLFVENFSAKSPRLHLTAKETSSQSALKTNVCLWSA